MEHILKGIKYVSWNLCGLNPEFAKEALAFLTAQFGLSLLIGLQEVCWHGASVPGWEISSAPVANTTLCWPFALAHHIKVARCTMNVPVW